MFVGVIAAQSTADITPEIAVMARATKGKVRLRWAATTGSAWLKLNAYGYRLNRYTLKREGVRLQQPERHVLKDTLKPEPLVAWEALALESDHAAILAQALYGESFVVDGNKDANALLRIINKSQEAEQRFAFGLFAADLNFKAAVKAGLGYEDTTVKVGESYLYTIESHVPKALLDIEKGKTLVAVKPTYEPLPAPVDVFIKGEDKAMLLSWDHQLFKTLFVGYFVERSTDGTTFTRLNKSPLVNMNDKPEKPASRIIFVDTIPQNSKTYHYRITGINAFGEQSPPSKVVRAKGYKKLSETPHITSHNVAPNGTVTLNWTFDVEKENDITGFNLIRANSNKGPFETLKTAIAKHKRQAQVKLVQPSNYFKVVALGSQNQKTTSQAAFVQTVDSIPPIAPIGLKAKVDSTGIVALVWAKNTESDLLGYRVFRANLATEEYVQLTQSPIPTENFQDQVALKSLNSKVYYKVVAVDQRFNNSPYSETLEVKKPDIVPPSSPVFKTYKVQDGKVLLSWAPSTSKDVVKHSLFRKNLSTASAPWESLFVTATASSYTDTNVTAKQQYRYAIFAEDDSGLMSAPSTPVTITALNSKNSTALIKKTTGIPDREQKHIVLNWKLAPTVTQLTVYKAKNGAKPVIYKQYMVLKTALIDAQVNPGNTYTYTLKALSADRTVSLKTITVSY